MAIVLTTSCYKVYEPRIDKGQNVLVVNGMITNKTEAYHIILSIADPYNSSATPEPSGGSSIYVTDDLGNQYPFQEVTKGDYASDSILFTGQQGQKYRLHIITPDGTEYESATQRLFPEVSSGYVYTEFDTQIALDKNTGLKTITHGADIFADIPNVSDTIPQFRFTSNLVKQYYYNLSLLISWDILLSFNYYCWLTENSNPNINLTGVDYSRNSSSINRHSICFLDNNFTVHAPRYDLKLNMDDTTDIKNETGYRDYNIHHRILYLNQYTLNHDTYLYYKSIDAQMQSEGKLFDPMAAQLTGNIKCISDPGKIALGFFEASSVNYSAYIVDFRNLSNSQPTLIEIPYILPPELVGCVINRLGSPHQDHNIPSFWVF
ncbi:MAG: DUF4249 domain-containing protein [Bacteroidota bacterium]